MHGCTWIFSTFTIFYVVGSILLFGFPAGSVVKDLPVMQETQETQFRSLGQEDPLKEGMATHSSILAWRIPWTEEPSTLQFMGSQRVGHDWVTKHRYKSKIYSINVDIDFNVQTVFLIKFWNCMYIHYYQSCLTLFWR